jgi:predicted nucleotidyltransferase
LNSSALKWPDRKQVDEAFRGLAAPFCSRREIEALWYVGSYARGDWGVGSDLDVVVVVSGEGAVESVRNALTDALLELPVPADVSVLTTARLAALRAAHSRYYHVLQDEAVWVCEELSASGP